LDLDVLHEHQAILIRWKSRFRIGILESDE
jgi:hypothetical protein